MQVSWIDSEHLKGLLQQLQDATPAPTADPQAWETHTLPDSPQPPALAVAPLPEPPAAEAPVPPPASDSASAPEVARIRDRLREVRERAEAAGLLKKSEPVAATAPIVTLSPAPEHTTVSTPSEALEAASDVTPAQEANPEPPSPPMTEESASAAVPEATVPFDASLYFEVPLGSILERLDAFAAWARQRVAPAELLLLDEHGDLLLGAEARAALVLSIMLAANAAQRSRATMLSPEDARITRQPTPEGGELAVMTCPTRLGLIHLAVEHPVSLPENEARLLRQALMSAVDVAA